MRHYLIPALIVALALLPLAVGLDATAAKPPRPYIAHARISVPLPPAPATLVMRDGFNGVTNPAPGVYHVLLEVPLEFSGTSALSCAGTKPGVTCAVEILEPVPGQPYTSAVVYRDSFGVPANGDVWIWALL